MIRILLLVGVLLLLVGPLRRPFFSAWRLSLPLVGGAVVGGLIACYMVKQGAPTWIMLVGPVLGAVALGGAAKELLDDVFGPKGR